MCMYTFNIIYPNKMGLKQFSIIVKQYEKSKTRQNIGLDGLSMLRGGKNLS